LRDLFGYWMLLLFDHQPRTTGHFIKNELGN
jgi:hypothetical protein